ncbi:BMP family lipoprotein [Tepidanaerobacter syntrophicus]|uniref:BMP family lipoprotein n=1 Tax=Tepidanaerobacter syntrophicus TaxID=224999 RepID=UPI001BD2EE08|nr:BMP family ABC transporter substrate-binding protein [Tepidanaerobacter syntrophicus]
MLFKMFKSSSKKITLLLATAIVLSVLFTGCGGESTSEELGIALITSAAGPNDNGYNASAIKGLERVKEDFGINYKVVESADIPGSLEELAKAGYKLIFSLEYNFDALIDGVGGSQPIAEKYPDTTFVVFNDNPNLNEDGSVKHENVISVLFDVHEASYLAGALSVLVNENHDELFDEADYNFTDGDGGRKLGFLGGTKSNGITVFSYGYAEGVNYIANKLGVSYTYLTDYNVGFTDSAAGATKANTFYSDGVNIIFSVAGSVGDGVTSKAKEVKKLAIEVDANKDNLQPGYILTSVLKNTEVPVYDISKHYKDNSMNEIRGKVINYGLESKATGITDLSVIGSRIKESGKAKWGEIKTELEDISNKIASGEIRVTNAQIGEELDKSSLTNVIMPND